MLNQPFQFPWLKKLSPRLQANLQRIPATLESWFEAVGLENWFAPSQKLQGIAIPGGRRSRQGLLLILPALALLFWNWKMLLALAVGMVAMALVYGVQTRDLQPWIAGLRHWLNGPHRLLLLCVPCGSLAMLGTYMGASVWDYSHNGWLVSCIVLQGLGMMLGLALLSVQFLNDQGDRFDNTLDDALAELTHPNPLSRLVAVRQLNRLLDRNVLSPEQARITTQALQLLLNQEPEALVREATLRSLEPSLNQSEVSQMDEAGLETL